MKFQHEFWNACADGGLADAVRMLKLNSNSISPDILNWRNPEFKQRTPLLMAVHRSHAEIVAMLLAQPDVQPLLVDATGASVLHLAAAAGNVGVVEMLLGRPEIAEAVNMRDRTQKSTALYFAKTVEISRLLVEVGADINIQNRNASSPIMHAVWNQRLDVAEYLIDCCAAADEGDQSNSMRNAVLIRNDEGIGLLHCISTARLVEKVVAIADCCVNAEPGSPQPLTSLCTMRRQALTGSGPDVELSALRVLLEHGSDPRLQNEYGDTALHVCCAGNDLEAAKLIVTHTYSHPLPARDCILQALAKVNSDGCTPLLGAMPDVWASASGCSQHSFWRIVKLMIEAGADANACDPEGDRMLNHYTQSCSDLCGAGEGDLDSAAVVRCLLGFGSDPNQPGGAVADADADAGAYSDVESLSEDEFRSLWRLPLNECVRRLDLDSVTALLEHGASPVAVDAAGMTAMGVLDHVGELELDWDGGGVSQSDSGRIRRMLEKYLGLGVGPDADAGSDYWQSGVPSLELQCVWRLKRMKSKVDQEYMVDNVLPDAMVFEHFSDWKGAAKWCVLWLAEGPEKEQAERELAEHCEGYLL